MKILLAIDDSPFSQAAAQSVVGRPWPPDTEIRVLHVIEPPPVLLSREKTGYDEAVWNARREQAMALVTRTTEGLRKSGLNVTSALEEGDPKSQIIDLANDWHADLIVLGSHGRKGLERFLMGSVSAAVARPAPATPAISGVTRLRMRNLRSGLVRKMSACPHTVCTCQRPNFGCFFIAELM